MKKLVCRKCFEEKGTEFFFKKLTTKSGFDSWCKGCHLEANKKSRKTKLGVISGIYHNQKGSSKARGHCEPEYSKEELKDWVLSQEKFHEMYNIWKFSRHELLLKPTVDRIDDYVGYSLNNIQLMTWGENKSKGYKDRKNGTDTRICKAVTATSSGFSEEFFSIMEASRQTGVKPPNIINNLKGRSKSAGGYNWTYKI